jgi:hypothetical protein
MVRRMVAVGVLDSSVFAPFVRQRGLHNRANRPGVFPWRQVLQRLELQCRYREAAMHRAKREEYFFSNLNALDAVPVPGDTINSFREFNQSSIDGTTKLEADLDGRRIENLSAFRIQSSVFGFILPDDNLYTLPAGTYFPAVDDGVYVMLQPLSPGSHLLHFTGRVSAGFSLDITYQLKVSP